MVSFPEGGGCKFFESEGGYHPLNRKKISPATLITFDSTFLMKYWPVNDIVSPAGKNFHKLSNEGSKSSHQDDSTHYHLEKFAQGQKKEGGVESIPEGGVYFSSRGGVLISAIKGGAPPSTTILVHL